MSRPRFCCVCERPFPEKGSFNYFEVDLTYNLKAQICADCQREEENKCLKVYECSLRYYKEPNDFHCVICCKNFESLWLVKERDFYQYHCCYDCFLTNVGKKPEEIEKINVLIHLFYFIVPMY